MRDSVAREVVERIVTLATPFINVRRRDPDAYADAIERELPGRVAWLMLGASALFAFVLIDALNLAWGAFAWLVGAVVLIGTTKSRLSRWLRDIARREQDDIVAALQPPDIDGSKLLVLCARGDEVRGWLRTWDLAAQAAFVTGSFLLWAVVAGARSNLPVVIGAVRSTLHAGLDQIRTFGFGSWALIIGAVVLCGLWAVVLMCSSIFRWPAYWGEPALANLLAEIGAHPVPGADKSHQTMTFDVVSATVRSRVTSGSLRHKAICDEPAIVSTVSSWITRGSRPLNRPAN